MHEKTFQMMRDLIAAHNALLIRNEQLELEISRLQAELKSTEERRDLLWKIIARLNGETISTSDEA